MRWRKRRTLWRLTNAGLGLVVLTSWACTVFKRSQLNLHLAEAVDKSDEARVQALLATGADPNARNRRFYLSFEDTIRLTCHVGRPYHQQPTIQMSAASSGNERILRDLLKAGGNVLEDEYERPALNFAVEASQHRNVELLIQYGADVNGVGQPITPLIAASGPICNLEDCHALLGYGADPNGRNREGETPLMYATLRGNTQIIRTLLQAGAKVNLQDDRRETALRWAVDYGSLEAVTLLLQAGADATLRDEDGKRVEHIALEMGQKPIAQLLRTYRLERANRRSHHL